MALPYGSSRLLSGDFVRHADLIVVRSAARRLGRDSVELVHREMGEEENQDGEKDRPWRKEFVHGCSRSSDRLEENLREQVG